MPMISEMPIDNKRHDIVFLFDLDDTLFPTSEHYQWITALSGKYRSLTDNNTLINMSSDYKQLYNNNKTQVHIEQDELLHQDFEKLKHFPKFILSNATYSHCYACLHAQQIGEYIHAVIDRNVGHKFWGVPYQNFFKPNPLCYQFTQY